jgi:hypothetical protein
VPISLLPGSLVDRACIIGPVCRDGGHPIIDLVQETRHPCPVRRASIGQVGGKDLAGVRVDRQVEFPPNPSLWRPSKVADVYPETCGIDEQVDRFICDGSLEPVVVEFLEPSGKCRVIGDRQAQPQEVGQ